MASSSSPQQSWRASITPYLIYLVLTSTLGPLQFGFHLAELNAPGEVLRCKIKSSRFATTMTTMTNNSSPDLPSCISMSKAQFGLVSSIYTLGGLCGALSAGPLSTHRGRLWSMRITTIFFILGSILESLAPAMWMLALGRMVSGVGAGAAIVVAPIYISEIAPKNIKGLLGASTQVMINVGIIITQVLGYFLSYGNMWRVILAVGGGLGVVNCACLFLTPESPDWLATQGRTNLARRVMGRIRGGHTAEEDLSGWDDVEETGGKTSHVACDFALLMSLRSLWYSDALAEEAESLLRVPDDQSPVARRSSPNPSTGMLNVAIHPDHYQAIIAVVGVMLGQQFCGINGIIMYSVDLLKGLLPTAAGLITIGVGVLNLIVTVACAPLPDRLGRKMCLLLSVAGMGVNALLLAIGLMYEIQILSGIATLLFVASFAVGLGPIPFILASELVGPEAVGATQSWALGANWTATFIVAQFFPILDDALGTGKIFFVFAAVAAIFFAFVVWRVPETKGKMNADEVWGRERRVD